MTRFAGAISLVLLSLVLQARTPAPTASAVDAVFAEWTHATPGCAVGVATDGKPVLAKGYGMADLEHEVAIAPTTIFEAGSVSKQFTAAAVMLLASDGKLSLDDPVGKYVPELPKEQPITIRQMLNHTSGLRDWGSVESIAGWPRTSRVYTHAHVLEIVSRQRALNFPPGTRWSYSNTGFNLAAVIVSRVSGESFPEFTRERLFQPLGMTHTSWRDDYTRIVPGRAIAYSRRDGVFHTDMPFENVYGNGGLLTTVGDLLKWNAHYDAPAAQDAKMVGEQQTPGHFNDGRALGYGLGLFVGTYKGLHEVYHSGSTAGYSAFLTRFPSEHVSVAVLCNATTARATEYAHAVADLYLGDRLTPSAPVATHTLTDAEAGAFAGLWKDDVTGVAVTIARDQFGLVLAPSLRLFAQPPLAWVTASGDQWQLDDHGMRHTDSFGTVDELTREKPWTPSPADLDAYGGRYESDEAETILTAVVEKGRLVLKRRPDTTIALKPVYRNAFTASGLGTVIFEWGATHRVSALHIVQDRVWNMTFAKVERR
jgi:CubicO group peptidase (beta-lactamase class C family)